MKLSEAIQEYLNKTKTGGTIVEGEKTFTIKRKMSPTSTLTYMRILSKFLSTIGNKEIAEIEIGDCSQFLDKYEGGKDTVSNILNIFFRAQIELSRYSRYGEKTPISILRKASTAGGTEEVKDIPYIKQLDLLRLLTENYVPSNAYLIAVGLQASAGFRVAELIGNEKQGGDIHGLTLEQAKQLIKEGKTYILGKRNKYRWVYLVKIILGNGFDEFLEMMKEHYIFRTHEVSKDGDDLFLPLIYDEYNSYLYFQQQHHGTIVYGVKSDAILENAKLTTHVLRHTFGTLYIENGGDLTVLQELMGHEDISTTQIYARATTKKRDMDVMRLEEEFKRKSKEMVKI